MEHELGWTLCALSGVLLSGVSVLLKLGARSVDVIQVVWLSGIGRLLASLLYLARKSNDDPFRFVTSGVSKSLLGWISFSSAAIAFASLDLGTATALVRCGWMGGTGYRAFSLLGVSLALRSNGWIPYVAAVLASATATSVHRHPLCDLVASPLVLLLTPSPILKVTDLSPLALVASISAGIFDLLSQRCTQYASSLLDDHQRQHHHHLHVARAIDVAAAFAWQHLFFQHAVGSAHYVTPPPDARSLLGIALIVIGPLLLARHEKNRDNTTTLDSSSYTTDREEDR